MQGHEVKARGVEHFGETGTIQDFCHHHGIDANSILHAAQAAIDEWGRQLSKNNKLEGIVCSEAMHIP
jgi:pyruvate dehydrogenase complex dehydrogenase (E1) component